jgi:hypothetical protein
VKTGFELDATPGVPDTVHKAWAKTVGAAVPDQSDEDNIATLATRYLQAFLQRIPTFPIEAPGAEKLTCLSSCSVSLAGIKKAINEVALNTIAETWEEQKVLHNQVYKAIKTATKEHQF